jgi:hypothetical protein
MIWIMMIGRARGASAMMRVLGVAFLGLIAPASAQAASSSLVQHIASAMENNGGWGVPSLIATMPNAVLAGNALILCVQMNQPGGVGVSVSDDKGNSWAAGPVRAGANQTLSLFYALNAIAGTQKITMTFSGGTKPNRVQATISEFNNVATSNAADGSNGASSMSPVAAGTFTTGTAGDLVYHCGVDDTSPGNYNGGTITAGPGFTLLSADRQTGSAAQYQIQATAGTINPSFTVSSHTWNSAAIALKSASAGTAPPPGIRIVHVQHTLLVYANDNAGRGSRATPSVLQFPSTGNLLVGLFNHTGLFISSVTDGAGNMWSSAASAQAAGGNTSSQIVYASNATTSSTLTNITVGLSGTVTDGHAMFVLFDVTGAAVAAFDRAGTASGNQTTNGSQAMATVTPSTTNGLIFNVGSIDFHTTNSIIGAGYVFDGWVNPLNDNAGGGAISTPPSFLDMDNPYGHYYNATTAPVTFTYGFNSTPPPTGILWWSSVVSAFKAAPVDTVPAAPSNLQVR